MAVDERRAASASRRLPRSNGADAEDVVDVVVREHGRRERRVGPPLAHGLEQRLRVGDGAGVEHDERLAGVDRVGAGEALVEEHAVEDLVALAVLRGDGVRLAGVERARPEPFGELADLRHRRLL